MLAQSNVRILACSSRTPASSNPVSHHVPLRVWKDLRDGMSVPAATMTAHKSGKPRDKQTCRSAASIGAMLRA